MEAEVVKSLETTAGEYMGQVDRIHKTGVDLMHCFQTSNEMATSSYDEFSKVTDAMAIQVRGVVGVDASLGSCGR